MLRRCIVTENGSTYIDMTPEEEADQRAEWAANESRPAARTKDVADEISELSPVRKASLKAALGI